MSTLPSRTGRLRGQAAGGAFPFRPALPSVGQGGRALSAVLPGAGPLQAGQLGGPRHQSLDKAMSLTDAGSVASADGGDFIMINVQLSIPDAQIQANLKVSEDECAWVVKQHVLTDIAPGLVDGLNYGLYCPPINNKAGKFLDDERSLREYSLKDNCQLELKYKRRIYRATSTFQNQRNLKAVNTKSRQRKFAHCVELNKLEKVKKALSKGLDPNFQDDQLGESPLTQATALAHPRLMIMLLVEGGAHLDYRARSGLTPLHRAAITGRMEALQALLDLGASPNSRDARGFTPLYHCVCSEQADAACVELLLKDYALVGATDENGWAEIHQVCRSGKVQHLQHLLFYGADINSVNGAGNTPLHISVLYNREDCARVLLFRGADKTLKNFSNQDAALVAVVSGNAAMAGLIKDYRPEDIVLSSEAPRYNTRRRILGTASVSRGSNLLLLQQLSASTPQLPLTPFSPFSLAAQGPASRGAGVRGGGLSSLPAGGVSGGREAGERSSLGDELDQYSDDSSLDSFDSDDASPTAGADGGVCAEPVSRVTSRGAADRKNERVQSRGLELLDALDRSLDGYEESTHSSLPDELAYRSLLRSKHRAAAAAAASAAAAAAALPVTNQTASTRSSNQRFTPLTEFTFQPPPGHAGYQPSPGHLGYQTPSNQPSYQPSAGRVGYQPPANYQSLPPYHHAPPFQTQSPTQHAVLTSSLSSPPHDSISARISHQIQLPGDERGGMFSSRGRQQSDANSERTPNVAAYRSLDTSENKFQDVDQIKVQEGSPTNRIRIGTTVPVRVAGTSPSRAPGVGSNIRPDGSPSRLGTFERPSSHGQYGSTPDLAVEGSGSPRESPPGARRMTGPSRGVSGGGVSGVPSMRRGVITANVQSMKSNTETSGQPTTLPKQKVTPPPPARRNQSEEGMVHRLSNQGLRASIDLNPGHVGSPTNDQSMKPRHGILRQTRSSDDLLDEPRVNPQGSNTPGAKVMPDISPKQWNIKGGGVKERCGSGIGGEETKSHTFSLVDNILQAGGEGPARITPPPPPPRTNRNSSIDVLTTGYEEDLAKAPLQSSGGLKPLVVFPRPLSSSHPPVVHHSVESFDDLPPPPPPKFTSPHYDLHRPLNSPNLPPPPPPDFSDAGYATMDIHAAGASDSQTEQLSGAAPRRSGFFLPPPSISGGLPPPTLGSADPMTDQLSLALLKRRQIVEDGSETRSAEVLPKSAAVQNRSAEVRSAAVPQVNLALDTSACSSVGNSPAQGAWLAKKPLRDQGPGDQSPTVDRRLSVDELNDPPPGGDYLTLAKDALKHYSVMRSSLTDLGQSKPTSLSSSSIQLSSDSLSTRTKDGYMETAGDERVSGGQVSIRQQAPPPLQAGAKIAQIAAEKALERQRRHQLQADLGSAPRSSQGNIQRSDENLAEAFDDEESGSFPAPPKGFH